MVQLLTARDLRLPTDDAAVIRLLRELNQPKRFFGEGPAERRERLARHLSTLSSEERAKILIDEPKQEEDKSQREIFWYTGPHSVALKEARYRIADYSIRQCNLRLDMARFKREEEEERLNDELRKRLLSPQQEVMTRVREIEDQGSYIDLENSTTELKTLTSCSFNPSANLLATSCRSGKCKIWSIPDMETHLNLRGHQVNANFITFSPKSGSSLTPEAANLASCSMDGAVLLWSLASDESRIGSPVCKLQTQSIDENGKQLINPISRLHYYPTGDYLATCCSDNSWRLWDLASQTEILHQVGHSAAVFDLAFHPDGSLAGSAGMDSYVHLWDLRSGQSIHMFEGHTKGIRSIDFSPNGYHMVTGSMDNSVKIWNLRKRKVEYTIPAHVNTVTTVMFEKENGYYLTTASFDKTVKFWSTQTWAPIKELDAFEDKVANFDISAPNQSLNSLFLATCHAKCVKLWEMKAADVDMDFG